MSSVLVVEDEQSLREPLVYILEREGFEVFEAADGPTALVQWKERKPDLILLDLMLPGMSGVDVCREIRNHSSVPIIMVTAKDSEVDKVVGLEIGADDYVTKPFSPREIVLRVQSILRRMETNSSAADELQVGGIQVDRLKHEVRIEGKALEFTATEFKLLTVLMERCGRLQSREVLLNDVWGYESVIDTRTVDTHIRRLREKLGVAADLVETVRGFGYRMVAPSA